MAKLTANLESAAVERRQFVYEQSVRSRMIRTNGKVARQETRRYSDLPTSSATEEKLLSLEGEIHKVSQIIRTRIQKPNPRALISTARSSKGSPNNG